MSMYVQVQPYATTTQQTPCGLRGLGCSGKCDQCSARGLAGGRGLGAFYDSFPAPFNSPIVLIAIAVVVLIVFGGGLKLFGGRKGGGNAKRARLRLIQAQAAEKRAQLLAS
jgi:hypothetical protein